MKMRRRARAVLLFTAVASLTLSVGCKSKPEPKEDAPITEEETRVETTEAPSAEELVGAPEPDPEQPAPTEEVAPTEEAVSEVASEAPAEEGGEGDAEVAGGGGDAAAVDAAVERKINRAIKNARGGDMAGAASTLEGLVDEPNGGFLAAYNLGVVYESQGEYEKAAQAYYKALTKNPDLSPALKNLSRLYLRQRRVADARKIVDRYINTRPRNLGHRAVLLEVMLAQGRYEDVVRQAKELLRKEERNVDAMLAMAEANYRLGRFELSKAILERCTKIAPERGEIYYRYGLVELKRNNSSGALSNFEKAVEVQPRFPEAHNNLGVLYHEARDYDAAIEHFNAALRDWPDFKQALLNLGNAHKGKGQFRDAEVAFRKAIDVDKEYADAYFNLALLYLDSEVPGMEKIPRLQKAVDTLNSYKRVSRGKLAKDDPADKYIAEAKKAIEDEKARQELMRESQMGGDAEEM